MNKHKLDDLSDDGKQELALALVLWKDFKTQGKMDLEIFKQAIDLSDMLGVRKEFEELIKKLPPLKIAPRY